MYEYMLEIEVLTSCSTIQHQQRRALVVVFIPGFAVTVVLNEPQRHTKTARGGSI